MTSMATAARKVVTVANTTATAAGGKTKFRCSPSIVLVRPTWSQDQTKILGISVCLKKTTNGSSVSDVWAPGSDNCAVQCYRAAQLLARCSEIQEDTICACYYAMATNDDDIPTRNIYLKKLRESGFKNVESVRAEIINQPVPDDIMDMTVGALIASGTQPNKEELVREMEEGHINRTAQVDTVLSA